MSSAGPIGPSALEALEILKSLRCQMENEDMDPTDVYVLWSTWFICRGCKQFNWADKNNQTWAVPQKCDSNIEINKIFFNSISCSFIWKLCI